MNVTMYTCKLVGPPELNFRIEELASIYSPSINVQMRLPYAAHKILDSMVRK